MSKPIKYSIVIPVYNNAETLKETIDRFIEVFNTYQLEFVLVDDDSRDASWEVMKSFTKTENVAFKIIRLKENHGQHFAIFTGFQYVTGDFIITTDADLQVIPEEFLKLIAVQNKTDADFVFGTYGKSKPDTFNNIGSRLFNVVIRWLVGMPVYGSNFKVIKVELIEKVKTHFHPSLFIDTLLFSNGSNSYAEVEFKPRQFRFSSYTYQKKIVQAITVLYHYFRYKFGKREKDCSAIEQQIAEKHL